ncbi:MAG: serine/threonine-protein phosphatase [Ruminococcus sp.]|nr:serine/threonine-protein phosphatase [Ruminococcus sp.]
MKKTYTIEYGCACTVGKVRKNNEDNFYCDKKFRLDPDNNEDVVFSGKVKSSENEVFAVFDGMGGEACGEIASLVAAETTAEFVKNKDSFEEYLYELSEMLNSRILEESDNRSLVLMGTTAAMIQFYRDEIYVLNAGDSPIYKLIKTKLVKISQDHVAPGFSGKAPLTKFLGTPDKNGLNPYIARGPYKTGDVYVLCTDGVTDMIGEEGLEEILCDMLYDKKPFDEIAKEIVELAKESGGVDNATVIVCKISK